MSRTFREQEVLDLFQRTRAPMAEKNAKSGARYLLWAEWFKG